MDVKSRIAVFGQVAAAFLVTLLVGGGIAPAIAAQVASGQAASATAGTAPPQKTDRLVVQANQLVYNKDTNVVTAEGNVQLYYQGRTLEADKVIYNRSTSRVYAEGNAKLTEADGSVTNAARFDLTDDFRSGFIDSLSTLTSDKTRLTAPRAERNEGQTTVLDKSTYTACAPCKEHPEKPPLWQVKAVKIIHKSDEQMIYYEDATFEFAGVPLAYFPYMSAADPSVTKKSGILAPRFLYNSNLGFGISIPYFWNIAPDYDVTLTPTLLTKQGVLAQAEFRQRLSTGTYNIKASGIYQLDPSVFSASPYGSGQRDFRGSIESQGQFYINPQWKYGWDVAVFSDKYFFQDYKVRDPTMTADYVRESISTVYLTGQGQRSYFDMRGYYIQGLSSYDFDGQQPLVLPTVDYNRTIAVDPAHSMGIGGEVNIDANITALQRDSAYYVSSGSRLLDRAYGLYDVCATANSAKPNFTPQNCLLRGIGGSDERASAQITWQRKFIDPIGEVWTPFAFARFDVEGYQLNTSDSFTFTNGSSTSVIANSNQSNFLSSDNSYFARAMPGVGLDWRYPFVAQTGSITHSIEPIAQVIVRPNEASAGTRPNEDAQSLFFDDTNLFEWNKFSGYDRVEGGVRANVGGQYSMTFQQGGYMNALFGESIQLAGTNSYGVSDIAQVAAQSGLETSKSDYVGRFAIAPNSNLSFIAKGRFDQQDFTPETIDLIGRFSFMDVTTSVQYSRYAAQPLIGYPHLREGVLLTGRYNFLEHYFVSANTTIDLNPYKYDSTTSSYDLALGRPKLSTLGLGVGYNDECTSFSVNYSQSYTTASNTDYDDKTLTFTLTLRTLASASGSTALGTTATEDGH